MQRKLHALWVCALLMRTGMVWAEPKVGVVVDTTPKLETLNEQIKRNPSDAQAYSNRGYVLALLGRKEEARADLRKTIELKNNGPMHNRVGWAYFNLGDYA